MIQIDSSYKSHISICSIQCNFNNVLPKSNFIEVKTEMEMETQTETETETDMGKQRAMETCDTN